MRAVLQRVSSASVVVNGGDPRTIGPGLMILLGVKDGGDTSRGKRPSFIHAAKGETAKSAYDAFLQELMNAQGLKDVQHGEFGADMQVSLVNDGPVTIIIDTDEWK